MGTATNVIEGVGGIYIAATSTSLPTISAGVVTWPAGWTNCGYTEGGIDLAYTPEVFEGKVDQELAPVLIRLSGEKATIKTNLAESTLVNMNRAISASTLSSTSTTKTIKFGSGTLTECMIGFDGTAPGGTGTNKKRTVVAYRAISSGTTSLAYKKGALTVLAAEWTILADSTKNAGERLAIVTDEK